MNPQLKNRLLIVCIIIIVISLAFHINSYFKNKNIEEHSRSVELQRDSLINSKVYTDKLLERINLLRADSVHSIFVNDRKLDSINKITYHEKAKVKNYTPARRNALYDSLFGPTR
jgi:hypothetical protein